MRYLTFITNRNGHPQKTCGGLLHCAFDSLARFGARKARFRGIMLESLTDHTRFKR
jgi:hypothetical protein